MPVLRDIMTRDVFTLGPELDLRSAIEQLAHHHFGGAPVVAGDRVVGVLSASDVLSLLASMPAVPARQDGAAAPDESELEVDVGPPLDEPAFFAKLWDDCHADLVERFEQAEAPEWDLLAAYDVAAAMTRPLLTLPSATPVREGAEFMVRHGIHRVLVVDDGQLAGIVTTTDIARAVADERVLVDLPDFAAADG